MLRFYQDFNRRKYEEYLLFSKDFTMENERYPQLADMATTLWTLKKHLNKLLRENNLENKSRAISSNLNKLETILNSCGYEITSYDIGQKYNDGMNVDILDVIKSDTPFSIIKDIIEPTILYNGQIIKKAKIIKEVNGEKDE